MNKYVIMGVQGCGKGTQAKLLCEAFDFVHICVGDLFRWNIQAHTKLAAKIKRIMDAGRLVPDQIVGEVIRRRLDEHDWNYGFVMDGFPRNKTQAEFFLENYDINAVIHLLVPDEVVIKRVLARRLCRSCGVDYNLIYHRPEVEDVCDVCGGKLTSRPDDVEEVIRQRLSEYHQYTAPVVDLFQEKELVISIDGCQSIQAVQHDIRQQLGLRVNIEREVGSESKSSEAPSAPKIGADESIPISREVKNTAI